MAMSVKELLADSTVEQKLAEEAEDLTPADLLALRKAMLRGPQDNMSFFAFTATPKFGTLLPEQRTSHPHLVQFPHRKRRCALDLAFGTTARGALRLVAP